MKSRSLKWIAFYILQCFNDSLQRHVQRHVQSYVPAVGRFHASEYNNEKYDHNCFVVREILNIYTSHIFIYIPVTIMGSPLLSILWPILLPSLLNNNKEVQQKLTIPSATINIPHRHLCTTLQVSPWQGTYPGFCNAGGLRVLWVSQKYHVDYLFASLPSTQVNRANPRPGVRRSRGGKSRRSPETSSRRS